MSAEPDRRADLSRQALVAAALADGNSRITHSAPLDDLNELVSALRGLGVAVRHDSALECFDVAGCGGHWPSDAADLHLEHDPAALHLLLAACCTGHGHYRIVAGPSLENTGILTLTDALTDLGAAIGRPPAPGSTPLTVRAQGLPGGKTHLAASDWPVRALLLAAPCARDDVFIELADPADMNDLLDMMQAFGVQTVADRATRFIVPAPQPYTAARYDIPPDAAA